MYVESHVVWSAMAGAPELLAALLTLWPGVVGLAIELLLYSAPGVSHPCGRGPVAFP